MAYRVRLYAPTGEGVTSLTVRNSSGTLLGTYAPAGTTSPCFDRSGLTTGITITPTLASGVSVSRWVINADGTLYYQYTTTCTIGYDSAASNVQVRLEVTGTVTTTYYCNVYFNSNGGSGAPSSVLYTGTSQYITVTLPATTPIRTGYTFLGWATSSTATTPQYTAGSTYSSWYASTASTYSMTLYAVWAASGGGARIGTGSGLISATPYIYNGGWQRCAPYIYNGGWKKGT